MVVYRVCCINMVYPLFLMRQGRKKKLNRISRVILLSASLYDSDHIALQLVHKLMREINNILFSYLRFSKLSWTKPSNVFTHLFPLTLSTLPNTIWQRIVTFFPIRKKLLNDNYEKVVYDSFSIQWVSNKQLFFV